MARRALPVLLCVVAFLVCSCDFSGYQFVQDNRLRFVEPAENASVRLPLTIQWTMGGGLPSGDRYAVFIDESPVAPGHALLTGDPDEITTSRSHCVIDVLGNEENGAAQEHQITVVLVSRTLKRQGESEWILMFKVPSDG